MVFCNKEIYIHNCVLAKVTILILIDGFLQYQNNQNKGIVYIGHNPYFNRWFSAIEEWEMIGIRFQGHNPYFNRWFSAIYF